MEEICFDNSVASIKGYLVTDLQRVKVSTCPKHVWVMTMCTDHFIFLCPIVLGACIYIHVTVVKVTCMVPRHTP